MGIASTWPMRHAPCYRHACGTSVLWTAQQRHTEGEASFQGVGPSGWMVYRFFCCKKSIFRDVVDRVMDGDWVNKFMFFLFYLLWKFHHVFVRWKLVILYPPERRVFSFLSWTYVEGTFWWLELGTACSERCWGRFTWFRKHWSTQLSNVPFDDMFRPEKGFKEKWPGIFRRVLKI